MQMQKLPSNDVSGSDAHGNEVEMVSYSADQAARAHHLLRQSDWAGELQA